MKNFVDGFVHLFFPKTCIICSITLLKNEKTICYRCISQLEKARHTDFQHNEIMHLFEGQIPIQYATAGFKYHKEGILQQLIFKLKYHHQKNIGYILGKQMGITLKDTVFQDVDTIIPVPLHPKRQRERGYNQSEWIAKGLGEILQKEVCTDFLIRSVHTKSQTSKTRTERFDNIHNVFSVTSNDLLNNKHILLVDDVVTTGSTLISCAKALQENSKNIQLSIGCLAKAD